MNPSPSKVDEWFENVGRQMTTISSRLDSQETTNATILSSLEVLRQSVSSLDTVRKNMMLKYDALDTAHRAKIANLERDNATLRAANNPIEVAKLNILLSRVSDALTIRTQ